MKAGDLHILVSAQMGTFEQQMKEVEKRASGVGANFADNFNAGSQKILGNLGKMIAGPMLAANIADSITNILANGGTIEQEFSAFFDRIPFLGSFKRLGAAIEDTLSGEKFDRLQSQVQYEEQAAEDARFAAALAAEKQLLTEVERLKIQRERLEANRVELDAQKAHVEFAKQMAEIEKATADEAERSAAGLVDNVEFNAFLKVQQEKRKLLEAEFEDRMILIEKNKQKELEASKVIEERKQKEAAETARKQGEAADRTSRELVQKFEKEMDDRQKMIEKVESARMGIAQETTSLSTALGSFRVSPYTDEQKKKNDETLVKEVQKLRRSMENVGAGGGFR
jgi:hypothetical protein